MPAKTSHAFERVLALTDLSAPSRHAVARAGMLAVQATAQLDLLNVMTHKDDASLRALLGADLDEVLHKAQQQSHDNLAQFAGNALGTLAITPRLHIGIDSVAREVERVTKVTDSELVVLGATGAGFMRRMLLGSTAERLLHQLQLPMLVVRQKPHEAYRNIIVAVDFSPYSAQAIRFARRIAPNASLTLLHVYDVPYETMLHYAGINADKIAQYRDGLLQQARHNLQVVMDAVGMDAANSRQLLLAGDAAPLIVEQQQELDADLVVVGRCGADVLGSLLPGGVTKQVLGRASCDVLVTSAPSAA